MVALMVAPIHEESPYYRGLMNRSGCFEVSSCPHHSQSLILGTFKDF